MVAYAADQRDPAQVYVGVVNDKETGGVFASNDGGVKWQQMSIGLGGRDVYSLTMTPDDTLLAGTSHGIFRLTDGTWTHCGTCGPPARATAPAKKIRERRRRARMRVLQPAPRKAGGQWPRRS